MTSAKTTKDCSQNDVLINEVSQIVTQRTGVQLGERQSAMVRNRLKKRILQLGLRDEKEYLSFFQSNRASESTALVSLMTTHHTYFFRESAHFEFLEKIALPRMVAEKSKKRDFKIRVWSSACSRGQEVYTLSMMLNSVLSKIDPRFTYEILGTDVDPESVRIAQNGVYSRKEIQEIPLSFLANHWAKGTGEISEFVKAKQSLKKMCTFSVMNLLQIPNFEEKFDIIFCRNVFIYFNSAQIKDIAGRLLSSLDKSGLLFIGISESINGIGLPIEMIGTSIYRHPTIAPVQQPLESSSAPSRGTPSPSLQKPRLLKVMCVDDSPIIHALLKRILTPENGYQIVANAQNGKEAYEMLGERQIDVITLDIHMPVQDGPTFLRSIQNRKHPPVVMLSSVNREDADLALECLKAGAADYVEKPQLSSLLLRADELRTKLRYAYERSDAPAQSMDFDKTIAESSVPIRNTEKKQRWISASLSDRVQLLDCLKNMTGQQPPTIVIFSGGETSLELFKKSLESETLSWNIQSLNALKAAPLASNDLLILDPQEFETVELMPQVIEAVSILIFHRVDLRVIHKSKVAKSVQILVSEPAARNLDPSTLKAVTDIVPATSFPYLSNHYFMRADK